MPAAKRKSTEAATAASKRAKTSEPVKMLSYEELDEMSKEDVIAYALELQGAVTTAEKNVPMEMSDAEVTEKARKARVMLIKGIEKLMKWTPSCKTGTARFSYDGLVQSEAVYKKIFKLPETHTKKMFKISLGDFERNVGSPRGSVRYDTLTLTGEDVNVKWIAEDNTFKVSGKYGK